ncbi:hypothetical protein LTS18_000578, partial [Coniosporium uncinatum]
MVETRSTVSTRFDHRPGVLQEMQRKSSDLSRKRAETKGHAAAGPSYAAPMSRSSAFRDLREEMDFQAPKSFLAVRSSVAK